MSKLLAAPKPADCQALTHSQQQAVKPPGGLNIQPAKQTS
jgi:hypothetical protein